MLKIVCKLLFSNFCEMFHCISQCSTIDEFANLLGAWFWTFFEACISSSVLKRSYRTFLVVLNAFLMHAFPFLSWNNLTESCERFWWFWTFFEACIHFSVSKCSCRELWTFLVVLNVFWSLFCLKSYGELWTFLVVLNVFWSLHSLFCLEILLRRVVNVFGGFERFLKHAFPFLSWNALAVLWTFLVVVNVFWSMHSLFCSEMLL